MAERPQHSSRGGSGSGARPRHPLLHREFIAGAILLVAMGAAGGTMLARSVAADAATASADVQTTSSRAVTEYPRAQRAEPVDVDGVGLDGQDIDIAAWRGKVVVINVWGSWCAPCRVEAPVLAAAARAYADAGVQFVGINIRDNTAAAIAFEKSFDIPYPSIEDRDGAALLSLVDHLPGSGVPVTLVLDREGRVAARVLGAVEESTLTTLLDSVLDEPEDEGP